MFWVKNFWLDPNWNQNNLKMRFLVLIKLVSICAGHIDAHAISDIVFHIGGFKLHHDSEDMHWIASPENI